MSPAQASAVGNLMGQCRQPITHNGPVQIDYTRSDMRLIGPADATFKYPGTLFPTPENFPKQPSTPDPLPLPPRPGNPPKNPKKTPDPRKVPGKDNQPGGHFPPEHMPVEPAEPFGPGEEPRFPGQPWGPNAFNGLWFGGEYIGVDRANRRIGLESNDLRRHAVFPTQFNRKGKVNSVEFVDKPGGSSPEFVRINISERPFQTIFSVESAGLRKITYISAVDTSNPDVITFETQEAWVFGSAPGPSVAIPNCCSCEECDCTDLANPQPDLTFSSASCMSVFCPEPDPEVCECFSVSGSIAQTSYANFGTTCSVSWEGEINGCYTVTSGSVQSAAYMYVNISCDGMGQWYISVIIYTAGVGESSTGQIYYGGKYASLCVKSGKVIGTVTDILMDNGEGSTCTIDLTFGV
jgi:hypothetical protein